MDPQVLLPPGAGLVVEEVQVCGEIIHLTVRCEAAGANCPNCGFWSEACHSGYERHLGDLPIAGRQAVVDLWVRRFRCYQLECPRKTFVEPVRALAERYAHRTLRLRTMLQAVGIALGGRPGSRHCERLAMPTSRTTLVRLVRSLPEQHVAAPEVLGVDEFALRRGRRYGTILVDGATHRVIDLLEDPSADALVNWLGDHAHANVEVVCRDRGGVYANAARRGAPRALQVADRWHLAHNLAEALERFSARALAMLRTKLKAEEVPPTTSPFIPPPPARRRPAARTEERHAEVHALLAQGLSLSAIARRLKLDRRTVRKFGAAQVAAQVVSRGEHYTSKLDPSCRILPSAGGMASTWRQCCSRRFNNKAIGQCADGQEASTPLAHGRAATPSPCPAPRPAHARLAAAPETF